MIEQFAITTNRPPRRSWLRSGGPTTYRVTKEPGGESLLECRSIRRLDRTGTHPLSGEVADVATLERESLTRFRILDATGVEVARLRHRMALPTRRMRMSWEMVEGDGPAAVALNDVPFSVLEASRRRSAGELMTTYDCENGWHLELYPNKGVLTVDADRFPWSLRTALVASVVVRALHEDPSF